MVIPSGKIAFIWKLESCARGDITAIIQEIKRLGCTIVALKVANGFRAWTGLEAFVEACHAAGLLVYGWHYLFCGVVYTQSGAWVTTAIPPEQEAGVSASQVKALKLDGFIIDAEREFKVGSQTSRARRYIQALKPKITVPIGLSSYRYPSMHSEFPWAEFLAGCDFHMPQVYWNPPAGKDYGPVPELIRSCQELKVLKDLPIIPIGRAYIGDGHPDPKPQEITDFLSKAKSLNLPGASFWALDFLYLHVGGKARADTIASFTWDGIIPPVQPPVLTLDERVTNLETEARKHAWSI